MPDHGGVELDVIDRRLDRLAQQPFRRKFTLRGRERATAQTRGPNVIRAHAEQLIRERVAPAQPRKDGKQTPYRGHPVFVAQHATATCCRTCLQKWHEIEKGADLTDEQVTYVVDVLLRWMARQLSADPQT